MHYLLQRIRAARSPTHDHNRRGFVAYLAATGILCLASVVYFIFNIITQRHSDGIAGVALVSADYFIGSLLAFILMTGIGASEPWLEPVYLLLLPPVLLSWFCGAISLIISALIALSTLL